MRRLTENERTYLLSIHQAFGIGMTYRGDVRAAARFMDDLIDGKSVPEIAKIWNVHPGYIYTIRRHALMRGQAIAHRFYLEAPGFAESIRFGQAAKAVQMAVQ